MKCSQLIVALLALLGLLGGCGLNFPTRYERIETDRVRSLGFVFDPAEAAPGDTVGLVSLYAGERVDSVAWRISLDYRFNLFGSDTALGIIDLMETVGVEGSQSLDTAVDGLYDRAGVRFVVPRTLVRTAGIVPEDWTTLLPKNVADSLPAELKSLRTSDLIDFVELLAYADTSLIDSLAALGAAGDQGQLPFSPEMLGMVGMLAQVFTVPVVVYCDAWSGGYRYETRSLFTVRYNSRLAANLNRLDPGQTAVTVNRNPQISWIGVYKVEKDSLFSFDPLVDTAFGYTLYRLYKDTTISELRADSVQMGPNKLILDRDTIPVQKGCSYFIAADSSAQWRDSAIVTDGAQSIIAAEELFYDWFYQPQPVPGVKPDSILIVANGFRSSTVAMLLPVSSALIEYRFSIWVVAFDALLGERLRPSGFGYAAAKGVLKLTDEYVKMLEKR